MKLTIIITLILVFFILIIVLIPVRVNAASTVTFNNCKVTSTAYYANGDLALGGSCKNGYWWFTRYSQYLNIIYPKNSYVSINGTPTATKRIGDAQISGIGWSW